MNITPLEKMGIQDLIWALEYEAAPGPRFMRSPSLCHRDHWSRLGTYCGVCLDNQLFKYGFDITLAGSRFTFVRTFGGKNGKNIVRSAQPRQPRPNPARHQEESSD